MAGLSNAIWGFETTFKLIAVREVCQNEDYQPGSRFIQTLVA